MHELGGADAEGADPFFSVQINNDFFIGDRSTVAVLNPDLSATPRSLSSWLEGIPPAPTKIEVHRLTEAAIQ